MAVRNPGGPVSLEFEPADSQSLPTQPVSPIGEQRNPRRSGFMPTMSDSATNNKALQGLDTQEQSADVKSMRRIVIGVLLLFALGGLLDLGVVRYVAPWERSDLLRHLLVLRAATLFWMGAAALRLFAKNLPSPLTLRIIDGLFFSTAALGTALTGVGARDAGSLYAHLLSCILLVRGIALPRHYRQSILTLIASAGTYLLTTALAAEISPAVKKQFLDATELLQFGHNFALLLVACTLAVIGGHGLWVLRRQVFPARSISRYRLQKRIGGGGMGEVWQAYHPALRRLVAIKLLRAQTTSPTALGRFEREVRATTELKHPNTIRVFDFGATEDGMWYYAMELLEGETLSELVKREGPLSPVRAVRMMRQASRAMAEAHGRGIVHRDLKPGNLFVTALGGETDYIKIIDFGVAKVLASGETQTTINEWDTEDLTAEGVLLGTPAYMAPEQFEGREVTAAADVFSLGGVLYFALTGQPPYVGSNLMAIRSAHFTPLARVRDLSPYAIPVMLEEIVMRCLEREPPRRYADAAELDAALAAADLEEAPPDAIE